MFRKTDMMTKADKELVCDFVSASMGRVLNRNVSGWDKPIPQGVSVYVAHPDTGKFEYMFTKDEKYPVRRDEPDEVQTCLKTYGNVKAGGVVLYLNSCMMNVASKHSRYCY